MSGSVANYWLHANRANIIFRWVPTVAKRWTQDMHMGWNCISLLSTKARKFWLQHCELRCHKTALFRRYVFTPPAVENESLHVRLSLTWRASLAAQFSLFFDFESLGSLSCRMVLVESMQSILFQPIPRPLIWRGRSTNWLSKASMHPLCKT